MPYISPIARAQIAPLIKFFWDREFSEGELNYIITQLLLAQKPERYKDYNALVGVLECCKLELYRRVVASYEEVKCETNGDVF